MTPLHGARVLVVEDDDDSREALRVILESRGAAITAVAGAREALAAIQRAMPDALVCDITMPETDGHAFMKMLRSMKPDRGGRLPAIALTALTSREARLRSRECGFHYHLDKPVDPAKLVEVLSGLLRHVRR